MRTPNALSRYASPQVLLALLALIAALIYALSSRAAQPAPPVLLQEVAEERELERRSVVLYVVQGELVQPIAREVETIVDDAGADLEVLIAALRLELLERGVWPEALPTPTVFVVELERRPNVVLDLPADVLPSMSVRDEATILTSLERTLLETGVERVAFVRDGEPTDAWLGRIATSSSLQ